MTDSKTYGEAVLKITQLEKQAKLDNEQIYKLDAALSEFIRERDLIKEQKLVHGYILGYMGKDGDWRYEDSELGGAVTKDKFRAVVYGEQSDAEEVLLAYLKESKRNWQIEMLTASTVNEYHDEDLQNFVAARDEKAKLREIANNVKQAEAEHKKESKAERRARRARREARRQARGQKD
jgi:hypothetical protein